MDRKAPVRMCCACGSHLERDGMLRIVKKKDGSVVLASGHCEGRGAYICNNEKCIAAFLKSPRRLEKSFRMKLPEEIAAQIQSRLGQS